VAAGVDGPCPLRPLTSPGGGAPARLCSPLPGACAGGSFALKTGSWLQHARMSTGRFQPILAVGRDGVNVPLRHGAWQEGATATVSVLDRRGKRLGTVYLGQMPEAGQGPLTEQLPSLLQSLLRHVDSQSLRLGYSSDDGSHSSDYYHSILQEMHDPQRPWCLRMWRRSGDY
jgi:hypothetical protein